MYMGRFFGRIQFKHDRHNFSFNSTFLSRFFFGNGSNWICLRHPESWIFDFCRCDFRKYFPCSELWEKRFFRVYGDDKKKSDFFWMF